MTATRRLTAILAADVAGYSRLMGADEEGTLTALKAFRREVSDPKVKQHRGRIVKTTGDGLLIEFGSVVDAVRCVSAMPCNSLGDARRDAMISRLSSCNLGSSTSCSSKKYTRSRRPSQLPQATPAGSTPRPRVRSLRQARVLPHLLAPHRAGHHHRAIATQPDTRRGPATVVDQHKPPPRRPRTAGVSATTKREPVGNRGGRLSATQGREVRRVGVAERVT